MGRMRRFSQAVVALAAAFMLSSCYYVDAVFDVNQEEELDVRIDSAIHEDFADADTARSSLQDQFAGEGMSRSEYSEGPWNGYRWSENNADPYNWEIERSNGDFIKFERDGENVKYTAKLTISGEVGDKEEQAKDVLDVKFSLDHAGTVISTNGNQSSETRITWTGQWDSTLNMEAVIDLTPDPAPAEPAEEPAEEPAPAADPEETEVAEEEVDEVEQEEPETTEEESDEEPLVTLAAEAVGSTAVATSDITTESGEIALDGTVYPARTVSGSVLAGGEVTVLAVDGDTVVVEAVAEEGSLLWLWLTLAGLVVVGAGVTVWLLSRSGKKATQVTASVGAQTQEDSEGK